MEMKEKPKVDYNRESETYKIQVGETIIYLEYGEDKHFNWTEKNSDVIHTEKKTNTENKSTF